MENRRFKYFCFRGSYLEVGRQYGETMRDELQKWNEIQHRRLHEQFQLSEEQINYRVQSFLPVCRKYSNGLVEQLRGMAEGANISLTDALLFQVIGEIEHTPQESAMECTTFAVGGDYTLNGKHYSGQNADMYPSYADKCSVVTFAVTGKPRITCLLPLGYLSYHGMNSEGLSCNHNGLTGSSWRCGLPRFFVSRIALECNTINEIQQFISTVDYIASRHTLFADREGNILSYEFNSVDCGIVKQRGGFFAHTNHYLCPHMQQFESTSSQDLINSRIRLHRIRELIEEAKGNITPEAIQKMLRDHENDKDSICVHNCNGYSTFASLINCLNDNQLLVAIGNPCKSEYIEYPV